MSDSSQSFPPSDIKLAKLRQVGALPFSANVMHLSIFLGAFIAVWFVRRFYGFSFIDSVKEQFFFLGRTSKDDLVDQLIAAAGLIGVSLVVFIVPVLLAVFIAGGIQTRFLFSSRALSVDFGRVFSFFGNIAASWRAGIIVAGSALILIASWFSVVSLLVYYIFSDIVTSVTIQGALAVPFAGADIRRMVILELLGQLWELFAVFFVVFLAYGLFVAIPSRFLVLLRFHRMHRMSRAEVEAELREYEVAPELILARSQRNDYSDS